MKQDNTGEKVSKWEEFVLASGIPLEQLQALESWVQACPRPERAPLLVQALIDPISQQFDNGRLMVSNRTQATKLYRYAQAQDLQQEALEDAFREWVHLAFIHVPPHITKKMAWFFRALKVEVLKGLISLAWPPTPLPGGTPLEEECAANSNGASKAEVCRSRHSQTPEEREARASAARKVMMRLWNSAVPMKNPVIDSEHYACGCPLYHTPVKKRLCALCYPDPAWSDEVLTMIRSILEPKTAPTSEEEAAPVAEPCEGSAFPYHPTREIVLMPEDNPALGWPTPDHAEWCARRLSGDLEPGQYEYEVLPTQYGRWGVEFRRSGDHQVEDIFLSKQEMYAYRKKMRARVALVQVLVARVVSGQV